MLTAKAVLITDNNTGHRPSRKLHILLESNMYKNKQNNNNYAIKIKFEEKLCIRIYMTSL